MKITPFSPQANRPGTISYGVTSYGYDVRLGYKFKVFTPKHPFVCIDPKNFDDRMMEVVEIAEDSPSNFIIIPPHSFVLGESLEHFDIPRDMACIVLGKSTYARCGLVVNVTPGEPEWKGHWTIELSNTTPLPMKVYAGEGIMQCLFLRSDGYRDLIVRCLKALFAVRDMTTFRTALTEAQTAWQHFWSKITCATSYADKKGKYQNQTGLTNPIVKKEGE